MIVYFLIFLFESYYTSWSQYRIKSAEFLPEDIDPFLCTHVIYSFAKIDGNKITNNDESDLTIGELIIFFNYTVYVIGHQKSILLNK